MSEREQLIRRLLSNPASSSLISREHIAGLLSQLDLVRSELEQARKSLATRDEVAARAVRSGEAALARDDLLVVVGYWSERALRYRDALERIEAESSEDAIVLIAGDALAGDQ